MERTRRGGRARRSPICAKCLWKPKKKKRKKTHSGEKCVSVWIDGANKKFPGKRDGVFFFHSTDWLKSVSSASAKQREDCGFVRPRDWRFVRSISKTLCRLHLIVLVDLIMFTHANRFANYSHMLFSHPPSFLPRPPRKQSHGPNISTSRLAACCGVTSGGTGTFMQDSEAPVTTLPCHMDGGTYSYCRCT
jgi:hypothetical protein